jgi:hypothetical protein
LPITAPRRPDTFSSAVTGTVDVLGASGEPPLRRRRIGFAASVAGGPDARLNGAGLATGAGRVDLRAAGIAG